MRIAEDGVEQFRAEKYELIIIDTSGRHKQEGSLFEEMEEIHALCRPDETIFVMDSTIGQAVFDQAQVNCISSKRKIPFVMYFFVLSGLP